MDKLKTLPPDQWTFGRLSRNPSHTQAAAIIRYYEYTTTDEQVVVRTTVPFATLDDAHAVTRKAFADGVVVIGDKDGDATHYIPINRVLSVTVCVQE